jgi:protein-S-isoprenylcysteine O-methyltransferase Ste14
MALPWEIPTGRKTEQENKMKAFGIILAGVGLILFFFTFLFFTVEDYHPYDDPVPLWPVFAGVAMVIVGLALYKYKKKN